jgi:hypothetical protein
MPQVTVYIREEDLELWKAVEKKSQFIHMALRGNDIPKVNKAIDERIEIQKVIKPLMRQMKSTVNDVYAAQSLGQLPNAPKTLSKREANGVCKIHGTPLDYRGRCTQKGCKYAH